MIPDALIPDAPTPGVPIPGLLILGIDTSGRQGSVALLEAQGEQLVLVGLSTLSGGQSSELLLPTIAALLARHGVQRSSIGLIGVASGPGSFTGLRVAIATAKGLAEAFATPLVAVSVLEAIALTSGAGGKVVAAIDAQRSEIFWGEYELASATAPGLAPGLATMLGESIASFADLASHFAFTQAPPIFTPDPALAARLHEAKIVATVLASPSAETFARIAYRKFLAGERADVATLDANYLRRSDAELFSTPKPNIVQRRK